MRVTKILAGILFIITLMLPLPGFSHVEEDSEERDAAAAPEEVRHGKVELKRQATNRGTPEETTKTI